MKLLELKSLFESDRTLPEVEKIEIIDIREIESVNGGGNKLTSDKDCATVNTRATI